MALADIYMLIHKQAQLGQAIENVYFYERTDSTMTAGDLIVGWKAFIQPKVLALQSNSFLTVGVTCQSLGDTADFDEDPSAASGSYGSDDPLPSFNALSYTLKPNNRAVRPGGKRIAGIPEIVTTKNNVTDGPYVATMETLRLALAANLTTGGIAFSPVIVKRTKTAVVGTVPLKYKYTLPVAGDPLVVAEVRAVLMSTTISHQVSRSA